MLLEYWYIGIWLPRCTAASSVVYSSEHGLQCLTAAPAKDFICSGFMSCIHIFSTVVCICIHTPSTIYRRGIFFTPWIRVRSNCPCCTTSSVRMDTFSEVCCLT